MANKSGRKVKHIRKIYKKKRTAFQRILSFLLFILIISVLVFLGYSAGKPIKEYFLNRGSRDSEQSSGWTPPETTTSLTTETTTQPKPEPEPTVEFLSYRLPVEALSDEATLLSQLSEAKSNGYTGVVVTLKADGGAIYYSTENEKAKTALAVSGTMSVSQIANAIKDEGLTAIAEISVLKDHITTYVYKDLSYVFADGVSMWIDNKLSKGGKPWMSPFSENSRQYISDITAEITAGGFDYIIASDLIFPPFRNSDLEYIGDIVKDENRHTSLTSMAHVVQSQVEASGGQMFIEVSASEAFSGAAEIFHPEELSGIGFAVLLDFEGMGNGITLEDSSYLDLNGLSVYEKTRIVLIKLSELSSPNMLIPLIEKASLSDEDLSEAMRAFNDLGYSAYIVE
ncbi:MAG: putative glycoside hydrolase [Oscillospiraceae bacterium]|jgi:hypothetical protein